ncbi:MAG: type IV pilus assembly protein PilM [Candidatus Doudnabacteria bacterium]|nr:type IV pilus assembly protein PilM [Candidatus Doudnabacteria bacterium]
MFFNNLFTKKSSVVGIDIGTANIKVAQIAHVNEPVLETYGMVNAPYVLGASHGAEAVEKTAEILKRLFDKAGITTNQCVISFPNSSVFTSVLELPNMDESEMTSAVEFEAKKYVPLALSDIDLSWTVLSKDVLSGKTVKILLTAVPKQITQNYLAVLGKLGLKAQAGEIEALALIRSLIGGEKLNCVIIDIGSKATSLNIVENGFLRLSRNLNVGGETITQKISESLRISLPRAEQFKKDFGVSSSTFMPETIKPVLNIIKNEVKQLLMIYQSQNVRVDKLVLVGGGAFLPGISDFFSDLKVKVELGNPLKNIAFSQDVESILKRYNLNLAIAIGLALRK